MMLESQKKEDVERRKKKKIMLNSIANVILLNMVDNLPGGANKHKKMLNVSKVKSMFDPKV